MLALLCALILLPGAIPANAASGAERAAPVQEPRRVVFAGAEAFAAGDGVLVRWETALEVGVIGYNLYRLEAAERIKVNRDPVIARDTISGGRYFVTDPAVLRAATRRYEWEALLITGTSEVIERRDLTTSGTLDLSDLPRQGSEQREFRRRTPQQQATRGSALAGAPSSVNLTDPSTTAAVKIRTTATGIHFLRASTLATLLGQTEAEVAGWITSGGIAMSNRGLPVVYIPGTGSGGAQGLFFYVEANRNNYTYENVYWLRRGNNAPSTVDGGNPTPPGSSVSYRAVAEAEQDRLAINAFISDPEADFWAWQGLIAGAPSYETWSFPNLILTFLVQNAAVTAKLRVHLVGASETTHLVRVALNGTSLGEQSWDGLAATVLEFECASTLLRSANAGQGQNVITVQAMLATGVSVSQVYVDGYDLEYTRYCRAATDRLEASASGNSLIMAEGFGGTDITVLDITDNRTPRTVTNVRIDGTTSNRRATFNSNPAGRYALFRPSVDLATISVAADRLSLAYPANLSDPATRASYVVVAPSAFQSAAEQLASYRSSRLRTKVVLLEDIYNEFSDGLVTPHAIASFVRTAYSTWAFPIRWLALAADGTYDYRDLQSQHDNFLPPLMISTDFGLFTSDSLFGDVLGDNTMRVSVGRIPLVNNAEMSSVLTKIQAYESESPAGPLKALLVADRPDSAGDFVAAINAVEAYLSPRYVSQKVYPEPYPVPPSPPPVDVSAMRTGIQAALNGGVDVLNYVGHGAADRFGKDKYLHVADVAGLANGSRLPLGVAMTCVAGQYSSPGADCLAEALLMTTSVGAVAAVAPTGLSYDDDAAWISRRIMQVLAKTTSGRLGDVLMQTFSLYNSGGERLTPVWMYNLIGDPALELLVPAP